MAGHTCSICLTAETSPLASVPCGHVFHVACVTAWLKVTGQCPTCRSACSQETVVRLYLHKKTVSEINEQQRTHQIELAVLKDRVKVIPQLKEELRNTRAEAEVAKMQCKRWKALADREAAKDDVSDRYGAGKDVFCGEAEAEKGERLRKIDARREQSRSREADGASTSGPKD